MVCRSLIYQQSIGVHDIFGVFGPHRKVLNCNLSSGQRLWRLCLLDLDGGGAVTLCTYFWFKNGTISSAKVPNSYTEAFLTDAITGVISVGSTWINLCHTSSSPTPILLAVVINSCRYVEGFPVIVVTPMSLLNNSVFDCSFMLTTPSLFSVALWGNNGGGQVWD